MKTRYHNSTYRLGLDLRVWWSMMTLVILSIGLAAYKKVTDEPCVEFTIATKSFYSNSGDHYYVGEDIRFTASARATTNIVWNFGDSTNEETGNTIVTHNYAQDGKYTVKATINGRCESIALVYVRKPNMNPLNNVIENAVIAITGTDTPQVNKPSVYITNATANNYEWTVLNRNDYKSQSGKITVFNFKTEGRYTIQLKLDNDRQKTYTKNIFVVAASRSANTNTILPPLPIKRFSIPPILPPTAKPATRDTANDHRNVNATPPQTTDPATPARTIIQASDRYLLKAFEEVIKGSKKMAEFDNYFCNGFGTKVLINNKNYRSFEEFFTDIKGNDRRKIESVQTVREDNCIISIKVAAKKKGFLGRWVDL